MKIVWKNRVEVFCGLVEAQAEYDTAVRAGAIRRAQQSSRDKAVYAQKLAKRKPEFVA
jgi:hypothetical protein